MSITTQGWGSGPVTTSGWGGGIGVPAAPVLDVGFSADVKSLYIQSRGRFICKISITSLNTQLAAFDASLDELFSAIEASEARLRVVEDAEHPLITDVKRVLNCKIYETDLDDQLAALDVRIDVTDSGVEDVAQRLRNLESALRVYRRQRRASP
jgi:chaperonin cofactor prefoldin